MKAEIDESGCLTLTPEYPTEDYALQQWFDDYVKEQGGATLQAKFTRGHAELTRRDERSCNTCRFSTDLTGPKCLQKENPENVGAYCGSHAMYDAWEPREAEK